VPQIAIWPLVLAPVLHPVYHRSDDYLGVLCFGVGMSFDHGNGGTYPAVVMIRTFDEV
jgi:hypothetical protein